MASLPQEKDEDRLRRRTRKSLSSIDDSDRATLRLAAKLAVAEAFASSLIPCRHRTSVLDVVDERSPFDDMLSLPSQTNSDGSILERAVRRGSQRGSGENNEVHDDAFRDDFSGTEFDLTTVTDDLRTHPPQVKKSKRKFISLSWFQRKRVKIRPIATRSSSRDGKKGSESVMNARDMGKYDAWMCGVCGKAFSSLEAAEKHEDYHIREVVADLGFMEELAEREKQSEPPPTSSLASAVTKERDNLLRRSHTNSVEKKSALEKEISSVPTASKVTFGQSTDSVSTPKTMKPLRELDSFKDLPEDAMIPSPLLGHRPRQTPRKIKSQRAFDEKVEDDLLMPDYMRHTIMLADEALVDVCKRAKHLILTTKEIEAERELQLLAKDKSYYDQIADRTNARTANPTNRFRSEGKTLISKVQNKLIDTYQLMKEGDMKGGSGQDHYERKGKGAQSQQPIEHTDKTIFVNVIVKNSIQVVRHELERLAKKRWEDAQFEAGDHFNRFRAIAHGNLVKLAGLALASDFTPRKVAVQLSNDLYWLLTPRLRRRGVTIETEIEYRLGPYFVLAVNVKTIDWLKLIKYTSKEVAERKSRWKEQQERRTEVKGNPDEGLMRCLLKLLHKSTQLTVDEVVAQLLAYLYFVHWIFYYPLLVLAYQTFLGPIVRKFIISSVADEIFYFVEEKGMEMEISVRDAANQAAFMLSALRELRADGREFKKKRQETQYAEKGTILGPLLGPAIKADKGGAEKPPGFEIPENLEYVGLELDLPVGFRRLRWALLSSKSQFLVEAVLRTEAKNDKIAPKPWSKHDDKIGSPSLPNGADASDFIGAERETSYLMPKSVFVKANMCYETKFLVAYNDYCFCVKSKTLTPEVPYGSTFIAWTQMVVINTGNDTCKMICSVEAEFPNGPPLVSRQIKSGMRAGVAESFILLGETISKYSDEYP